MKKTTIFLLITAIAFVGCSSDVSEDRKSAKNVDSKTSTSDRDMGSQANDESDETAAEDLKSSDSEEIKTEAKQPKNVREFFMLLPSEYFGIEGCEASRDRGCQKSKQDYLKKYGTVEDLKNGYMEAGGDGAQGTFKMAIFKRPDASYIIGLNSFSETADKYKFLEFEQGKWADISIEIVPEYSSTNIYEFPRNGTTTPVFAKEIVEQREGFEISKKGIKLYDLVWENGKFSIKR